MKHILFMKNTLSLFSFMLVATTLMAQEITTKNGTPTNNRYGLYAGYLGYKLSNPGLQVGVENYLATTSNFKVIGSLSLQFYNEADFQSALAVNARFGQRYTTGFGFFLESYFGLGVQQTFFTNKTFEYIDSGVTIKESKESKTGVIPNLALGFGYAFGNKTSLPLAFFIRPSVYGLYPDRNLIFQTTYALETGFIYAP